VSAQTLQQQAGHLHGRQMVMLVTVALHALVIAGLMMMKVMPELRSDIRLLPIDMDIKPPPEATPTDPKPVDTKRVFSTPPVDIPIVDIPEITDNIITLPPETTGPVAETATMQEGPGTGTAVVPDIPSTPLQFRAVRPADDYYPSASQSLQEEGMAIVRVCVSPAGALQGKPSIQTSSGSPRLDAAALAWAREALRFTPATERGAPVAACKGFRVNFKLR
jgi:TonB family protein